MLQAARGVDLGGPNNAGNAAQNVQSQNRNVRLFHSILRYINPLSGLYRYVTTVFNGDGRGLFNYLWHVGHLAYTRRQQSKREQEWKDASIASLHAKNGEL